MLLPSPPPPLLFCCFFIVFYAFAFSLFIQQPCVYVVLCISARAYVCVLCLHLFDIYTHTLGADSPQSSSSFSQCTKIQRETKQQQSINGPMWKTEKASKRKRTREREEEKQKGIESNRIKFRQTSQPTSQSKRFIGSIQSLASTALFFFTATVMRSITLTSTFDAA